MKLAFLSYGSGWHVHDLGRAAAELGHTSEFIDFRTVQACLPAGTCTVSGYDAVIVRSMPPGSLEQVVFRMDVLHQVETRGVRVVNGPRALEICIDKYLASARLQQAGLPVPATVVCQDAESAVAAFHDLGGDVVVKPLFGSEGRGMLRVSQADLAWRVFRTLERTGAVLYVQEFIHHPGWDLRVFVLAGRVLAAMRRFATDGWRTNVAQGGRAEPASVTESEAALALRAAAAVGAHVCGIDLLPLPTGGYVILEVNAVPGWRALGRTTTIDIASEILRSLEPHAA